MFTTNNLRNILLYIIIVFYFFAGLNHFVNPNFYYPLIPNYLGNKIVLNSVSGVAEIGLALGFIFKITRQWAAIGTVLLLVAFIPAHIYFITQHGCLSTSLCVPAWVAWVRLFPLQFILMAWAWYCRK